jgi:CO/xanthine dehydrogenase FAD-binding subunit
MASIQAYHRPQTLTEALQLLARKEVRTALVAGGTSLVPELDAREVEEVVDLQDICPRAIELEGDRLAFDSLVRLQTLVDDERVPPLLRDGAFREGPNTFRHQATVGGVIASAHWESELLAALLVQDAVVTLETPDGRHTLTLGDYLSEIAGELQTAIITQVTVATGGQTGQARVARTPLDTAIVAALARRDEQGELWLALTGVAATPVLVAPEDVETLDPPGDFRGSKAYRQEMATILSHRALAQLDETQATPH